MCVACSSSKEAPSGALAASPKGTSGGDAASSSSPPALSAASTRAAIATPPSPFPPGPIAIHVRDGLSELPLGTTSRKDVEAKLGPPNEVVQHGTYSTTIEYKSGISATYCQADPAEAIFAISFRPPFPAFVKVAARKETIVLGQSTVRDARLLLGDCEWTTTDTSPTWACNYDRGDGRELSFHVQRDETLPRFPLNEARHIDRPISVMEVTKRTACPSGNSVEKAHSVK